jgi:hypothetical protein
VVELVRGLVRWVDAWVGEGVDIGIDSVRYTPSTNLPPPSNSNTLNQKKTKKQINTKAILLTPSKAGLAPLARVAALEILTRALQVKARALSPGLAAEALQAVVKNWKCGYLWGEGTRKGRGVGDMGCFRVLEVGRAVLWLCVCVCVCVCVCSI